jgi:hypothetical protein
MVDILRMTRYNEASLICRSEWVFKLSVVFVDELQHKTLPRETQSLKWPQSKAFSNETGVCCLQQDPFLSDPHRRREIAKDWQARPFIGDLVKSGSMPKAVTLVSTYYMSLLPIFLHSGAISYSLVIL